MPGIISEIPSKGKWDDLGDKVGKCVTSGETPFTVRACRRGLCHPGKQAKVPGNARELGEPFFAGKLSWRDSGPSSRLRYGGNTDMHLTQG